MLTNEPSAATSGQFRERPIVIDAARYVEGNQEALLALLDGVTGWHMAGYGETGIVIPTLEGDHLARPGDWIVKGVQGEVYPVKHDIFEETYEPA